MEDVLPQHILSEAREAVLETLRKEGYDFFIFDGELVKVWKNGEAEVLRGYVDDDRITIIKSKNVVRLLYRMRDGEQTKYKAYIYYPHQHELVEFFTVNCQKKGGLYG